MNETKEQALETFKELLLEKGINPKDVAIEDFGIEGGETNATLQEYVNDLASDIHSARCEERQARARGDYEYMEDEF